MRVAGIFATSFTLALSGCFYSSPEDAVLRAFSDVSPANFFSGDAQPEYLTFADKRAASILGGLVRSGRFQIAPADSPLFCPKVAGVQRHGYAVGLKADTVHGDSAYATVVLDCAGTSPQCPDAAHACVTTGGIVTRYETLYLLVRKNGRWAIAKPISGAQINLL
jgi:hypothetical protein